MTITFQNCEQINISHSFLLDVIGGLVTKTEITTKLNCCEDITWVLDPLNIDVVTGQLTVLPEQYSQTEILTGVYSFKFKVYYVDGTIKEITGCRFNDCNNEMLCKIIPTISDSEYDGDIHIKYYFLNNNTCECVCDEMCELYKSIISELKLETNKNCTTC